MTERQEQLSGELPPALLVDPASLHILLVDAHTSSRQEISSLLRDCDYQVTACRTSQEAIQILKAQQGPQGTAGFDLILKEHSPASGTNACRLLRRCQTESVLRGIPIIGYLYAVASNTEDRDVMVSCLQLGAADYMLKPLRHNELRNLWARVYWWRRASYLQQLPSRVHQPHNLTSSMHSQGSGDSEETKCVSDDEQPQIGVIGEEHSREGSAPNGSQGRASGGNGSKNGSKGSKEGGLGWSGTQPKPTSGSADRVGNSASKAEQGSNHPSSEAGQPDTSKPANGWRTAPALAQPPPSGAVPAADASPAFPQLAAATSNAAHLPAAPLAEARPERRGSPLRRASVAPAIESKLPSGEPISKVLASPSGFKAYVPTVKSRKRPADQAAKDDGARSSGSDRTESLEKLDSSAKRRAFTRFGSQQLPPMSEAAPSDATLVRPGSLAGDRRTAEAGTAATMASGTAHRQTPGDSRHAASAAWAPNGQPCSAPFNSFYPYGMLASPFALPAQMWGQMQGSVGPGAPSESEMQNYMMLAQQMQAQGAKASMPPEMQHQRMVMHNQLMLQHSLLMQQYGMPPPPFPAYSSCGGGQAAQFQVPARPAQAPAVSKPGAQHPAAGADHLQHEALQRNTSAKCNGSSTWNPAGASGVLTGTGTGTGAANGNTLGTANHGTGATSHTTAQVGPDGCMVEPSRKERRAQALFKYKQKRKNLNFTKKIRYESRKQLAQARPRVKGQFVRVKSDDMEAVVNALAADQQDGVSSGDVTAPRIAIEKAGGDKEIAAELVAAAVKQLADRQGAGIDDYDIDDEDDDADDDDVNSRSPALRATARPFPATAAAPAQPVKPAAFANGGPGVATIASRHSSDSGSNSPDLITAGGL